MPVRCPTLKSYGVGTVNENVDTEVARNGSGDLHFLPGAGIDFGCQWTRPDPWRGDKRRTDGFPFKGQRYQSCLTYDYFFLAQRTGLPAASSLRGLPLGMVCQKCHFACDQSTGVAHSSDSQTTSHESHGQAAVILHVGSGSKTPAHNHVPRRVRL